MAKKVYKIKTLAQTRLLARNIAKKLHGGELIALSGDLGSGKTTFTQYLGRELGVKQHLNSPTFVIMKRYRLKSPLRQLLHLDAYRLSGHQDLEVLGIDQYLNDPASIIVVEWSEKIPELIKSATKKIQISFAIAKNWRTVTVK